MLLTLESTEAVKDRMSIWKVLFR